MGLQEGLQIAQWLMNLQRQAEQDRRQAEQDRQDKAYRDFIINERQASIDRDNADRESIGNIFSQFNQADQAYQDYGKLRNQDMIMQALGIGSSVAGGPLSGLADAFRFAVDTASEELQPWMVNPYGEAQKRAVMSNMSLEGLEKFNKILPSVSNRLTSDWLSRQEEAKKNAEWGDYTKKEMFKSSLAQQKDEANFSRQKELAKYRAGLERMSSSYVPGIGTAYSDFNKGLAGSQNGLRETVLKLNDPTQTDKETLFQDAKDQIDGVEKSFALKFASEAIGDGVISPSAFADGYFRLPMLASSGKGGKTYAPPRITATEKTIKSLIESGNDEGVDSLVDATAKDAVNVFLNGRKAVMFVNLGERRPAFEKAWDDSAKSVYNAVEDRLSKIVSKYHSEALEKRKEGGKPMQEKAGKVRVPAALKPLEEFGYLLASPFMKRNNG